MVKKIPQAQILIHILLLLFLGLSFIYACKKILSHHQQAQMMALDWLRPATFRYLCPTPDIRYLKLYEVYFNRINNDIGQWFPEINGLLGYCAYQHGNLTAAAGYYQKALDRKPKFFWYYYNLGIIELKEKKYDEAFSLFQTGLSLDLKDTFETVLSSPKIYMPIIDSYMSSTPQALVDQLKTGQQTMIQLAVISKIKTEQGSLPALMCY